MNTLHAVLTCLWYLVGVLIGTTDPRTELHDLGLDR